MTMRKSRSVWISLLATLVCLGIAVALIVLAPGPAPAIDSSHTTQYPTPGAVTLPPTAPAAILTPTAH